MHKSLLAAGLAGLTLVGAPALATTVADPVGDFLPSFVGAQQADLDVISFGAIFNGGTGKFTLFGTMAGTIDLTTPGIYVIGARTGPGGVHPFDALGQPNVIFNQAIVVRKSGNSTVGANVVTPTFSGASFSVDVPLAFLPSTGWTPLQYGFNLWPRNGLGNNNQITDFAPENANLTAAAVPEPASWALMIGGLALAGAAMRRRRTTIAFG